jgi:pyridoxamine 5'-phosphate oxidase
MPDTTAIEHLAGLTSDLRELDEPLRCLATWLAEAARSEPCDPTAMALATVDANGVPDVRMVLLKGLDRRGLVFYTNAESQKGRQLAVHPTAAVAFHWKSLARQVRLRGAIHQVDAAEADAYFASRPRLAQIGAWASRQSAPLESRLALEQQVARFTARYAIGSVPRPPHWTGFRLAPASIEFWRDRPFRLHERTLFARASTEEPWTKTTLYP